MKDEILVSIIMPAYNAEKTITDAIRSVCRQTYRSWELIIVDDGSTDTTRERIRDCMAEDARIRLLENEKNSGVSVTRNRGIRAAAGEWTAFLDSDDLWDEDKLRKQIEVIRKRADADLVFTGSAFVNAQGVRSRYVLEVPETMTYRRLLAQNLISCSSVLVRKELVQTYRMQHDDMHEDFAVWLQILKAGHRAYGINEPLLIYRLSEQSKSGDKKQAAMMTWKVYRFMKLDCVQAMVYFCLYALRNMKKYKGIRAGFEK